MKILVVGGGGREHAMIKKLRQNPAITEIFAAPGNGGISYDAVCADIKATDIDALVAFAQDKKIDYAIVAPDDPLVLGLVDRLAEVGIAAFGPSKAAAIIEGSKVFSKQLMQKYNIPTAQYGVFDSLLKAAKLIKSVNTYPIVIKADGLALGKGVIICENEQQALTAIKQMLEDKIFGASGSKIVIEEFLTGPEVSVLAFTDGKTIKPLTSSMDHKRALDGDKGLNTGGMGAIAPNPYYTKAVADECMEKIFIPTMNAMNAEGRTFKGCLYFGLMLTENGPKVIEYNCRFGDPEAQVVLPLLKSDLLTVMQATTTGTLADIPVECGEGSAACVVIASGGYPESYEKGKEIFGLTEGQPSVSNAVAYHAGTAKQGDKIVTNGGRVLGVTAVGMDLRTALDAAYAASETISFDGAHKRSDIGKRALEASEK
ncbi:MAG: phosphoribosylamine--glycine ligase [Oscillospiraceae bacterium]